MCNVPLASLQSHQSRQSRSRLQILLQDSPQRGSPLGSPQRGSPRLALLGNQLLHVLPRTATTQSIKVNLILSRALNTSWCSVHLGRHHSTCGGSSGVLAPRACCNVRFKRVPAPGALRAAYSNANTATRAAASVFRSRWTERALRSASANAKGAALIERLGHRRCSQRTTLGKMPRQSWSEGEMLAMPLVRWSDNAI